MINIKRPPIKYFAPWAIIQTPYTKEKHYIKDNAIHFDVVSSESYANHIEMSGLYCSAIISYGVDKDSNLMIMRHVTYPTLRTYPNTTHGSLNHNYKNYDILVNGIAQQEKVSQIVFNGTLIIISECHNITIKRTIYPASTKRALCERLEITNRSASLANIKVRVPKNKKTLAVFGHDHQKYRLDINCDATKFQLAVNASQIVNFAFCGSTMAEKTTVDNVSELTHRLNFLEELDSTLIFDSPNKNINLMAYYAKIRSAESIFMTKSGLMHSPGGGGYYAAIWTNDQCEYINPLFGYLGYDLGIKQAKNTYKLYEKYISAEKALISSIIAEGDAVWHGAKDRGDSAMYAYGASRFLLTLGDKQCAQDYIEYIDKCLEYTLSQVNTHGVVQSDSDELEGRFLTGNANLCTSCIAYDALISAHYLHQELGNIDKSNKYFEQAVALKDSINSYFGKTVEGFDTYMYCKEESKLRSWIAMPLVVGIFDKAENTKNALLSGRLRVREGLLTRSGETTFWDRSTLYTLRGLFNAGFSDEAYELLDTYTKSRLLGEHIPYAVEAFPEGNQAQLSAESSLYLRILVEGILGFRPTGFGKFILNPSLPNNWNGLVIDNIVIANQKLKIKIKDNNNIEVFIKETAQTLFVQRGEVIHI